MWRANNQLKSLIVDILLVTITLTIMFLVIPWAIRFYSFYVHWVLP